MKRFLVVYHANCNDGLMAAAAMYYHFCGTCDFLKGVYQTEVDLEVFKDRDVFIVDFSYPFETMVRICEVAKSVVLLDHHASALKACKEITNSNFDMSYCTTENSGAVIAWKYVGSRVPLLANHIQDRDLWKFEMEGTKEINAALLLEDRSPEGFFRLTQEPVVRLLQTGKALLLQQDAYIDSVRRSCTRKMLIGYHEIPTANANGMFASELGNILAKESPCSMAATYYDTEHGRVFSLRSVGDEADVSEVAKRYGGGGHFNAAGFKVPRDHQLARS